MSRLVMNMYLLRKIDSRDILESHFINCHFLKIPQKMTIAVLYFKAFNSKNIESWHKVHNLNAKSVRYILVVIALD